MTHLLLVLAVAPPSAVLLDGQTFTLPPGYAIQRATTPGLVSRPIVAAFDDGGSLYVAEASGTNDPVGKQLKERPHRVVKLSSSKGDGVFDTRTVFADGLMLPQGVMWRDGSLYVGCPPSIWKLTDTTGKGVADRREEWYAGKTLTGCANDLHGPYAGPDGWIYWTKGAFAEQRHPRPGKPDFVTKASHVFRARADGSGVEAVMVGGMDNPVGLAFTASGERVFSATFLQHPAGGRRDGLAHAVYGAVHGKDHSVIHQHHPWTGPDLMPVMTHLGPAAPAGMCCVGDTLFASQFNLRKVSRHTLAVSGATFVTKDDDFLVSSGMDFHPTDVVEDADGSLLVIDTGGWYKLCCPTSQFHKPDVSGGIYRVRRTGVRADDPRGAKLDWTKAAELLDDPRPAVRRRAVEALGKRGLVPPVTGSAEARRNAVWAATRIDGDAARAAVRAALRDDDEGVRQVALHSISLHRDAAAAGELRRMLASKSAHNRRAAAEALGRIGDRAAVPGLLAALPGADFVLTHSLVFALIEIADREATRKGLAGEPATRRGALIALDAIGGLTADDVTKHLVAADEALRAAAWWVAGRHPEWAASLVGFFADRVGKGDDVSASLSKFAARPEVQRLMASRLRDGGEAERRVVLRAMAGSGLKALPEGWASSLAAALKADPDATLATIRSLNAGAALKDDLGRLADSDADAGRRLTALAALPPAPLSDARFALALAGVGKDEPFERRGRAAEALARAPLSAEQRRSLAKALPGVGPMERSRLLEAFATTTEPGVAAELFAALRTPAARAALHPDAVRSRLGKVPGVEGLLRDLDADAAGQRDRLEKLLTSLPEGDVRRGQAVFHSAKAACVACHAVGYVGGKIGPDLTTIGKVRSRRDLLESVIYPSSSFVRGYEPVSLRTRRGVVHSGVVKEETPTHVVLTLSATEEVRVSRREVEEMTPGRVSVMPAGLDKALSANELADLLAFLGACR